MNTHKKWCVGTLSATLAFLLIIAGVTIFVDPFFHYHKPFEKIPYTLNDQNYQNPGIVRHFDYDALITGTSMTENFKISNFAEVLGVNAIKVPYAGGRSMNMRIILEKALKNNPNLQTVYLGLDLYMLKAQDTNETRNPLPEFLYNSNPFDDVRYLYNKDVFFNRVKPSLTNALKGTPSTSFDQYSSWYESYTFSQYTVIGSDWDMPRAERPDYSLDDAIKIADDNLKKNILPLIEAYPQVKFVIFYPPYSILYWYSNYAEYEIGLQEHAVRTLMPYPNVEQYLFQNDHQIVTDLYNYKDYTHYGPDINTYMVHCFKDGTHRLTPDNVESELSKMKDLVKNFDYGLLFGQSNPFIRENNLLNYLDKLNDSRYIAFVASQSEEPVSAYDIFGSQYTRFGLDNTQNSCGFGAIIQGDTTLFQKSSDIISFHDVTMDLKVGIVSEKRDGSNYVQITIDGTSYTTNQPGVNIVVYDTVLQRVLDNIAVDITNGRISRV